MSETDDDKLSTGGYRQTPCDEWTDKQWDEYVAWKNAHRVNIPGPAFEHLVTREDVQAASRSLAKLATQAKRAADMLERLAKHQKEMSTSMRQIVSELKKNKWN
jgi:plasmid stabilization system protein ParE